MSNVLIRPDSGILEFSTGTAGGSGLDTNLSGASRIAFNSGELVVTSYSTGNLNRLSIQGANGQLFSVDDNMTGTLFSVSTVGGNTLIEAHASGWVKIGEYAKNIAVASGSGLGLRMNPTGTASLVVTGDAVFHSMIYMSGNPVATGAGGAAQTPWTQNINAASYHLTGINSLTGSSRLISFPSGMMSGNWYVSGGTIFISGNPVQTGTAGGVADPMFTTGSQLVSGLKDFLSGLKIPYAADPIFTGAGRIAFDTTDSGLLIGTSDTTGLVISSAVKSMTFVLDNPSANETFPIAQVPMPIYITKVTATTQDGGGNEVTFNLEERIPTGLNDAGSAVNIMTNSLTGVSSGMYTTSFSNAHISGNHFIVFRSSATGASGCKRVVVKIDYNIYKT